MSTKDLALAAAGASSPVLYADDVFSTWLRTGTGTTATVSHGVDLSGGGLVISKSRSAATDWSFYDTARGATYDLASNTTAAQTVQSTGLTAFANGSHTIGSLAKMNTSGATYADFVFKKATKFFDVVTYTGNGTNNRSISHNLGVSPGMVIVKSSSNPFDWCVWHRSLSGTNYNVYLNNALASSNFGEFSTDGTGSMSSSSFVVSYSGGSCNTSGQTYVAYLFAHDTSADGIIQAGSYIGTGGMVDINLGWEPQFVIKKNVSAASPWSMYDVMRGMTANGETRYLWANSSNAEDVIGYDWVKSNGMSLYGDSGQTFIYIAIRRPNKPPTSGTQVYNAIARSGTGAAATVTGVGFAPDLVASKIRTGPTGIGMWYDKLRGANKGVSPMFTSSEFSSTNSLLSFSNDGYALGIDSTNQEINYTGYTYVNWNFKRAPGFFDEVCWSSTGSLPQVLDHNLTVVPELIIRKPRSIADEWAVGFDFQASSYKKMALNTSAAATSYGSYSSGEFPGKPTATQFTDQGNGVAGRTFVAYLFATCAGVSKVGSYTGNGTSQTINCGFAAGARFILIKRTDSTGHWYTFDTARGIVAGNDPHLSLNNTGGEVTTDDSIDPDSTGFIVNQVAGIDINVNAATYIYLAIA